MTENVLLITIDSLRTDHIGPEADRDTAPNITAAGRRGTSFSQAVANGPSTPSSFPSILTGTLPLMYGGYHYLDDERPFVAKKFEEEGYTTVGYHSNPHLGSNRNYDAGFDTFNDTASGSDIIAKAKDSVERKLNPESTVYSLLRRVWHYFTLTTDSSAYAKAPTITENATDWLTETWDNEEPFFMWLHYMDVHYPFAPPDQFLEEVDIEPFSKRRITELNGMMQENPDKLSEDDVEDLLKLYDSEIRFTDHNIGKVLDELDAQNALDDTLVVITADHGEAFGEHGRFGHHPYLYDELLRVPLIVRGPGVGSEKVKQHVSLLDIAPTLYDLLDFDIPISIQGTSLKPLLQGENMEEEGTIVTGLDGGTLAYRTSEWKCFWRVEKNEVELYDLETDPEEVEDVSSDHPKLVSEFREVMENYLREADETDIELPEFEDSTEVKQRLRDLGYID